MAIHHHRRAEVVLVLLGLAVFGRQRVDAEAPIAAGAEPAGITHQQLEFFEKEIRPLLAARCHECHGADKQEGNLRLDSRAAVLAGGDTGAAIEPGQPDASLLIDAVRYGEVYQMPPTQQLPPAEIALLEEWVRMGAPWAPSDEATTTAEKPPFDLQQRKTSHWAWQPITRPAPPALHGGGAAKSPVDAFLLSKLEIAGLERAAAADRGTLLRRASFDLTGLPPTAEETAAFEADAAPDAFAKVVDRLLASPHFGERWARHWLDIVRYAETLGHESDFPLTNAWRYRDYVIRALNADVPYDQFVREHVAGDLLTPPRRHPTEGFNESVLATAFWYLGESNHAPVDSRADQATRIENQVDVFSKAFLGLTVACARCHDHKFDAISTKDYYALAGYAASSHQQVAYLDPNGQLEAGAARLVELHRQGQEAWSAATSQSRDDQQHADKVVGATLAEGVFEDFTTGFDRWFCNGWAFGDSPTAAGDWRRGVDGPELLAAGMAHSGRFGDRLPGVIRSSTFTIDKPYILYQLSGRKAKVRLIVDGYAMDPFTPLLFEGLTFEITDESWHWHAQHVERHMGHRAHIELVDAGKGYVAVDEIRFADSAESPADDAAGKRFLTSTDVPSSTAETPSPQLISIAQEAAEVDASLPAPIEAVAIGDGSGEDWHVHIRGNYKTPGELAPRGLLEALAGADQPATFNSGRLELAERMLAPESPFVARVIVNRIWRHLFGRGLVATADNFGVLGEAPTHPELLDYLASRFVEERWSVKRLIREIMLSDAYQLASAGPMASEAADPQNRLLHRANVRRLEGEAIRDALLAITGRLDRTLGGPPVPIHLTPFMDGRGKPAESGPLDGAGRRSIYLEVRRNFLSPFLLAFDMPPPASCVGQRNSSNVPAQALSMLNDPFVLEQCKLWAERIVAAPGSNEERVTGLYRAAFARPPMAEELAAARDFIDEQRTSNGELQTWTDLCHVLVNVKEFIFLN